MSDSLWAQPEQPSVAAWTAGPVVVSSGAGTGKAATVAATVAPLVKRSIAVLAEVHADEQVHLAYCGVGCERNDNPEAQFQTTDDDDDTVEAEEVQEGAGEREEGHAAGGAGDG